MYRWHLAMKAKQSLSCSGRGAALVLFPVVLALVIGFLLGSRRHQVRDAVARAEVPAVAFQAHAAPPAEVNTAAGDPAKIAEVGEQSPTRAAAMGEFPAGAREELGALPSAEQTSLWAAFSEARREAHPIAAHQRDFPQNRGYDYFASNPGQRINARFGVSGVRFGARGESFDEAGRSGAGWEAVLRLKRVAGREVSDAVAVCQSAATKTRMEIEHAAGVQTS